MREEYIKTITDACIASQPEAELRMIGGSGIRLADVLYAMLKADPANRTRVTVESSGQFITPFSDASFLPKKAGPYWNLLKDSVTDQETPTLKFLAELLGDYKRAVTNQQGMKKVKQVNEAQYWQIIGLLALAMKFQKQLEYVEEAIGDTLGIEGTSGDYGHIIDMIYGSRDSDVDELLKLLGIERP